MAEFDHHNQPLGTFPYVQSKERWTMYQCEARLLPEALLVRDPEAASRASPGGQRPGGGTRKSLKRAASSSGVPLQPRAMARTPSLVTPT